MGTGRDRIRISKIPLAWAERLCTSEHFLRVRFSGCFSELTAARPMSTTNLPLGGFSRCRRRIRTAGIVEASLVALMLARDCANFDLICAKSAGSHPLLMIDPVRLRAHVTRFGSVLPSQDSR